MDILNTLRVEIMYLVKTKPKTNKQQNETKTKQKTKSHLFFEIVSIFPLHECIYLSHNFTNQKYSWTRSEIF